MSSEAAKRATAKYQRDKMESISIRVKRDDGLYNRIKQAATVQGIKPAQFIKQALLNALDAPQPVQAAQPQPQTTTAPRTALTIEYPPDMKYNERIQLLIDAGITSSISEYVLSVIGDNLDRELSYNGVSLWRYEHGTTEPRHK